MGSLLSTNYLQHKPLLKHWMDTKFVIKHWLFNLKSKKWHLILQLQLRLQNYQLAGNTPSTIYTANHNSLFIDLNLITQLERTVLLAPSLLNDVLIGILVSYHCNIYHFNGTVKLKAGVNTLAFDSAGVSDWYSLIIDNVKLTSAYNSYNLISKGDFSSIPSALYSWNYYNNGILNWWAAKAAVGHCSSVYNNL